MGKVYLVGAGPGSADLLTLRAARLIQSADTILFDALVGSEILQLARPNARLISVGKRKGRKSFEQDDINALLIYSARTSNIVVRLKGGDPTLFGRAAEEISVLRSAGIEFEIVPGVTAACSAAAAAKVSLTDRHVSSAVTLTTAHYSPENDGQRWNASLEPNRTLVIYMPGSDYEQLSNDLLEVGFAIDTPCLVVSKVASADEQTLSTAVGRLSLCSPLPAPSVIIVGDVTAACERSESDQTVRKIARESMESRHVVIANAT